MLGQLSNILVSYFVPVFELLLGHAVDLDAVLLQRAPSRAAHAADLAREGLHAHVRQEVPRVVSLWERSRTICIHCTVDVGYDTTVWPRQMCYVVYLLQYI